MAAQPIKISLDPDLERPYPPRSGKCREQDGRPRNVIYLQNFSKTVSKSYIRNGTILARYRYPRFVPTFHSPLVNDYNQNLAGGWYWQYREDGSLRSQGEFNNEVFFARLEAGRKPLGGLRFFIDENEEMQGFLARLCRSGLPFVLKKKEREFLLTVCQRGHFGSLFDMDCLLADYTAMQTRVKRPVLGPLADLRSFLSSLKEDCLERYLRFDHRQVSSTLDTILTGLILGYPLENTFSLLLQKQGQG